MAPGQRLLLDLRGGGPIRDEVDAIAIHGQLGLSEAQAVELEASIQVLRHRIGAGRAELERVASQARRDGCGTARLVIGPLRGIAPIARDGIGPSEMHRLNRCGGRDREQQCAAAQGAPESGEAGGSMALFGDGVLPLRVPTKPSRREIIAFKWSLTGVNAGSAAHPETKARTSRSWAARSAPEGAAPR